MNKDKYDMLFDRIPRKNKYILEPEEIADYILHLEDEITQLTNNRNELEEWVESEYNRYYNDTENLVLSNVETMDYSRMLDKMKEIKERKNENI